MNSATKYYDKFALSLKHDKRKQPITRAKLNINTYQIPMHAQNAKNSNHSEMNHVCGLPLHQACRQNNYPFQVKEHSTSCSEYALYRIAHPFISSNKQLTIDLHHFDLDRPLYSHSTVLGHA